MRITDWIVRPATVDDAQGLAVCHIESWREAYRGLVPDHLLDAFDTTRSTQQWTRIITELPNATNNSTAAAQRRTLLVAVADKPQTAIPASVRPGPRGTEILGFAHAGPPRDHPRVADRELYALYLRAARYGTGIAQELMRAILLPDTDTALWVFEENPRARSFYRKFGFAADGARRIEPFSAASEIRMVARRGITERR